MANQANARNIPMMAEAYAQGWKRSRNCNGPEFKISPKPSPTFIKGPVPYWRPVGYPKPDKEIVQPDSSPVDQSGGSWSTILLIVLYMVLATWKAVQTNRQLAKLITHEMVGELRKLRLFFWALLTSGVFGLMSKTVYVLRCFSSFMFYAFCLQVAVFCLMSMMTTKTEEYDRELRLKKESRLPNMHSRRQVIYRDEYSAMKADIKRLCDRLESWVK